MGRNITLNLDDETLRRARVVAAKRGQSISALLRAEIRRMAEDDEAYALAREAARRRLKRGSRLGGGPYPSREELHDRAKLR